MKALLLLPFACRQYEPPTKEDTSTNIPSLIEGNEGFLLLTTYLFGRKQLLYGQVTVVVLTTIIFLLAFAGENSGNSGAHRTFSPSFRNYLFI